MHRLAHGNLEQAMPGRMEVDLVDPVPVAVVGAQDGRVGVGLDPPGDRLVGGGDPAQLAEAGRGPSTTLAGHGFDQGEVAAEEVLLSQRRRLVEDLARIGPAGVEALGGGHGPSLPACIV